MSYRDLRGHINKLEEAGELHRVKVEVDSDVELSAIMRQVFKQNGPACFFEKVKGTKFPVFSGAMFGHKKYSLMVDAPPNIRGILKKMLNCLDHPIDPIMVNTGPCKENIDTGDKIDLYKFPAIKWHDLDAGPFFGTLGTVITRDPDTGIKNLAVYRQQLQGKNKLGFNPEQHSGIHLRKFRAMNKPMPVATAIGVPPSVLAAALTKAPYGVDEMGIAGAIAGEPIPLVKCKTIDLEVPADAEIVLEGEVPPDTDKWEQEGPFGEFTGHFHSLESDQKPTIYLTAVTYRNNPIYQGCSPGIPPNEETTPREIGGAAGAWQGLLNSGIPGIKEVNVTEMGCAGFVVIVSMDRHYYLGNVRQIIYHIMANFFMSKWVIVVDDDIDIFNMGEVNWALATRVQPHRDIFITDNRFVGVALDPSVPPELSKIPRAQTSKIGIDATKFFKGHDFPPLVIDSEKRQKQIAKRWKEYGFK